MLKSKSIFLILFWNFLVLSVFHYIVVFHRNNEIVNSLKFVYSTWCFAPVILLYPLMGWLADTRFGRYSTIKCGLWVMWASSFLLSIVSVVKYVTSSYDKHYWIGIDVVLFTVLSLGLSLFQANIIQFGIDQLIDATSADITSYINWYVWTLFASKIVLILTQKCSLNSTPFSLLSALLLPVFLSLSLLSDLFFSEHLIKEPVTHNPLSLLWNVLRYAAKTKHPRLRSAFTYWNDKPYSRLDLAKNDFGGPFSTEEVENVKTFFRILILVCIMSPLISIGYMYTDLIGRTINFFERGDHDDKIKACLKHWSILEVGSGLVVVIIPFYELLLIPISSKWLLKLGRFLNLTSRNKFKAGTVCLLIYYVIHLILYRYGTHYDFKKYQNHCILYLSDEHHEENLTAYYWIPIPKLFECFAKIWLFGSALEFICAQSPYSMKGLLFGMVYTVCGVFVLLSYGVFLPFHYNIKNIVHWEKVYLGCGFWFCVCCLTVTAILAVVFFGISYCYKKRQRSENPPNEHFFAEAYYDHSEPDLPFISDRLQQDLVK